MDFGHFVSGPLSARIAVIMEVQISNLLQQIRDIHIQHLQNCNENHKQTAAIIREVFEKRWRRERLVLLLVVVVLVVIAWPNLEGIVRSLPALSTFAKPIQGLR